MKIKTFFSKIREYMEAGNQSYTPKLRIAEIFQDQHKDYFVIIQTIGKNITFKMKPEKILANDKLTNQFSPVDIRSLTYLGYLGINSPQYKVLAERFSSDGSALFTVVKKGEKEPIIRTAAEVLTDKEILTNLDQEDISRISFFAATESNISTRSISQETGSKIENEGKL